MPVYSYEAFDRLGKRVRGRVDSSDRQAAVQELKQKGLYVTKLSDYTGSIWQREIELGSKRIPARDFIPFLRQFATLFKAGVTLVESLRILSEQTTNKKLKKILLDCASQVARGNQLSEALREHDGAFPPVFANMIRAGEITGNLEDVLERLASYLEKEHYTREKVKSALTYPAVISIVAAFVTVFLLVDVVPNFVQNLQQLGGHLPTSTKIVLAVSGHLVKTWYLYLLVLGAAFVLLRGALRTPRGRYAFDSLKLRLPIFGPLLQKAALARASRTIATLLSSAVPTLQVFTVAAGVVGNEVYARALLQARDALREGQSIVLPLRREFPPLVTQMIAVGEQTGNLDEMFAKIADFYEADVETTVDKLRPLIEPLMILLLAILVGTIVVATIAPIFEIYGTAGRAR
jgi:type IV pilus assembly protein PilC